MVIKHIFDTNNINNMKLKTKIQNGVPTIHTTTMIKGEDACKLIWNKQMEYKMSGANEKNLGIIINIIINEYVELLKTKKQL